MSVQLTELVLRDGHQSLIATRMTTAEMLPICPQLDAIGFWSLEVWGGATFDSCLRYLNEDPWQRLRQLRTALPNSRLQMLLRGQNLLGYRHYADDIVDLFVARAAANGIDIFRIFDALNDLRNMERAISAVKANGRHAQGTLCYTTSPYHTLGNYTRLARQLADLGCDSIAIKDMAGLLTPTATAELISALQAEIQLPIHLHCHDSAGLASLCQMAAIQHGCRHIDTAISPFSGGASHAPTESMVAALRGTEWDSGLDLAALQEIAAWFRHVRDNHIDHASGFTGIDTRVQVNQVPGGMVSNLVHQLREQGALDRIDEVLAEIPRVRHDMGYPPLVTPTSQIVGSQAVINVLSGQRYQTLTQEVKRYLSGGYGRPPGPIAGELSARSQEQGSAQSGRPADHLPPEIERLRQHHGDLISSDEDLLTLALFPEIGEAFLRGEGAKRPASLPTAAKPAFTPHGAVDFTLYGQHFSVRHRATFDDGNGGQRALFEINGALEEIILQGGQSNTTGHSARPLAHRTGEVSSPIPGTIVAILVNPGDRVNAGSPLLVTEAMKMESELVAPIDGKVIAIHVTKGDRIAIGECLLEIEPATPSSES
jgi:pyruvate carboxylase subunit B